MKVLVTGHRGYIGTHLVDLLRRNGHWVTGCDLDLFAGCCWEPLPLPQEYWIRDFRSLTVEELSGFDCVMHLAAISNDPMGELDPGLTYGVNREGAVDLAKRAKAAGVSRFLFASSCSMYGGGGSLVLDETAPLDPLSAYAESKIDAEKAIHALEDASFSPVSLRSATAYGHSPNLRIDLVVNNLLGCAVAKGKIQIMSDGEPWRPLIHCRDIARAFVAFGEAPRERVHNTAVNIGGNKENYQVKDVAGRVKALLPEAEVVFTGEVGYDPRNYRVNFDLLGKVLPDFELEHDLDSGMRELWGKYREHQFDLHDFEGDQFVRLRMLRNRLNLLREATICARSDAI